MNEKDQYEEIVTWSSKFDIQGFNTKTDFIMSDSESEPEQLDSRVSCLYNIIDLQRVCQKHNLKFSEETNKYLLYHTLKQLGPVLSQKLVTKREYEV